MNVKALRQRLGLTQLTFAQRLGVGIATIKRWEAGVQPRARHLAQLDTLAQAGPVLSRIDPSAQNISPVPPASDRRVLRLGEAVRQMGLKDEGHGRRSDHTIRKAIKLGRLRAWKAPGYRVAIGEWCFYADEFETWRASHYQAHRDPRRNDA